MKVLELVVLILAANIASVVCSLSWARGYSDGAFPYNSVSVGFTARDALYVCRAYIENNLIPGKLHPKTKRCFVTWAGDEHIREDYDVAVGNGRWVSSRGDIPIGAFYAGNEDGETLYACRASVQDLDMPGKFKPSHRSCYIPFAFKEHRTRDFDVLVG